MLLIVYTIKINNYSHFFVNSFPFQTSGVHLLEKSQMNKV